MKVSKARIEQQTGESVTGTHEPLSPNTDQQAFKNEAQKIRDSGGVNDPGSLNKINSPGGKGSPTAAATKTTLHDRYQLSVSCCNEYYGTP